MKDHDLLDVAWLLGIGLLMVIATLLGLLKS